MSDETKNQLIDDTKHELLANGIRLSKHQIKKVIEVHTRRRMGMLGSKSKRTMTPDEARATRAGKKNGGAK